MFVNEKELVEKLVLDLQDRFDTRYIVRELRGGNNIADVVYTTDIHRSNVAVSYTHLDVYKRQPMVLSLRFELRTLPYEIGQVLSGLRRRRGEPVL